MAPQCGWKKPFIQQVQHTKSEVRRKMSHTHTHLMKRSMGPPCQEGNNHWGPTLSWWWERISQRSQPRASCCCNAACTLTPSHKPFDRSGRIRYGLGLDSLVSSVWWLVLEEHHWRIRIHVVAPGDLTDRPLSEIFGQPSARELPSKGHDSYTDGDYCVVIYWP